jgi:hypothetical protein
MDIINLETFSENGIVRQDEFVERVDSHDWEQYRDRKVLVRGCDSRVTPPWTYMIVTARLAQVAQSVRFGNEHDNLVVYRRKK